MNNNKNYKTLLHRNNIVQNKTQDIRLSKIINTRQETMFSQKMSSAIELSRNIKKPNICIGTGERFDVSNDLVDGPISFPICTFHYFLSVGKMWILEWPDHLLLNKAWRIALASASLAKAILDNTKSLHKK